MCNISVRRFIGLACGAVWIALGITGCGGTTTVVAPSNMVSGKVTVDGQPAVSVRVRFIPTGETKGFGGFAVSDQRGDYMIESQGGGDGPARGKIQGARRDISSPGRSDAGRQVFRSGRNAVQSSLAVCQRGSFSADGHRASEWTTDRFGTEVKVNEGIRWRATSGAAEMCYATGTGTKAGRLRSPVPGCAGACDGSGA